ncbi:MAG: elongation factor G [Rhodospirillaceae bacterium]|jgi:elongation factor G|nr:elongation factor G [Rhodospirillaceae bacterium]
MAGALATGTRCAALVGPYLSGKTTLLESLLFTTGAIPRKGTVKDGSSVGDSSPESRARQMSTELSVAHTEFLGDEWAFIDCPGSVELSQESFNALLAADVAVIVCEPSAERAVALAPIFRFLQERKIPHMVFINKMDTATQPVQAVLESLQIGSGWPLLLRHLPIVEGEEISGYVDLVSERAYKYKPGEASDLITIPGEMSDEEELARQVMLESLADFDDDLLEQLLEDAIPPTDEVYEQLTKDLRNGLIVPVFMGAAEQEHGVRRLMKALRHETPSPDDSAARLGINASGEAVAQVFKTLHAAHSGKLSLARVWRGEISEGETLGGMRVGGLSKLMGANQTKSAKAVLGDVVALGRMDEVTTGDILTPSGEVPEGMAPWPKPLTPVYAFALEAVNRADEVKLTGALQRLNEEDPSVSYRQDNDIHQLVLMGQGEIHLQLAIERLNNKYNVEARTEKPRVPYKESIQKGVSQHARFKRQTGGHGMFGDVHVDIKPLPRGTGFQFADTVVGGSVPKQYIPAVEAGAREFLDEGALGFPVVDLSVTLTDGQFHAVDSNEMSFKLAAREAMKEGLPKCAPVLLEPILKINVDVPSEFTNKVHGLISGRRGQIQGFDAKEGWTGWDAVGALMPQSEIQDLIIELRSLTQGVATYQAEFDHLQELTGRLADQVVQQHRTEEAEAS